MEGKLVRRVLQIRPVYCVFHKLYSHDSSQSVQFYSDKETFSDKHKPLVEEDYNRFFSSRSLKREPAITRLMASLAYKYGKQMLSLAEGMPNEEVFPYSRMQVTLKNGYQLDLKGKELATALQYVPSRGLPHLLTSIDKFQQHVHRPPPLPVPRELLVTNGAQHAIYQCAELLMEPGDPVIMAEYAYTGAQIVLKPYDPEILAIPEDSQGLNADMLEAVLSNRLSQGLRMPKLLYLIPTGNNPTGSVTSEERRRQIYELACKYDFLILEDDPYMFLNYTETVVPSFLSLDRVGRVVRADSLSKVVSAGLRAAWLTAPAPLLHRLELHSQAELLHPCTLSQVFLADLLSNIPALATHLSSARALYRRRRDALLSALDVAGVSKVAEYTTPDAGLFIWLRVSDVDDVYNMVFETAFKRGLMLIPGQAFLYESGVTSPFIRLTFSKIPEDKMLEAARHLVAVIKDEQRQSAERRLQRIATER